MIDKKLASLRMFQLSASFAVVLVATGMNNCCHLFVMLYLDFLCIPAKHFFPFDVEVEQKNSILEK